MKIIIGGKKSRACASISDEYIDSKNIRLMEQARLLSIKDAYPKMVITRIWQPEYQHEGIRIIDAAEWLSEDNPQK